MGLRVAIKVAYFNTLENNSGFQIQPSLDTIQGFLIKAILKTNFTNKDHFNMDYAARTDNGVNALSQVISFNLSSNYSNIPERFLFQINSFLPKNIRCWAYSIVSDGFHPRFDAVDRQYTYIWYEPNINSLNYNEMLNSANKLIGEKNFINFAKKDDSNQKTIRTITSITIEKKEFVFVFNIIGKSFLWQQCRRIVSHLIQIGKGEVLIEETIRLLDNTPKIEKPYPFPSVNLILSNISYENIIFIQEKTIIKKIANHLDSFLLDKKRDVHFLEQFNMFFEKLN